MFWHTQTCRPVPLWPCCSCSMMQGWTFMFYVCMSVKLMWNAEQVKASCRRWICIVGTFQTAHNCEHIRRDTVSVSHWTPFWILPKLLQSARSSICVFWFSLSSFCVCFFCQAAGWLCLFGSYVHPPTIVPPCFSLGMCERSCILVLLGRISSSHSALLQRLIFSIHSMVRCFCWEIISEFTAEELRMASVWSLKILFS